MNQTPPTAPRPRYRWLRWIGLTALLAIALLIAGTTWLVGSASGLRFALARAQSLTHGALQIQEANGRLMGPLDLVGLHYDDGRGTVVTVSKAHLDLHVLPLLHKRLHVLDLNVDSIDVALPKPPPEDTSSSSSFSWKPPIALVLDRVHVGPVAITQGGKPLFASNRLDFSGRWTNAGIAVNQLALDAPDGHIELGGRIGIGKNYRGTGNASFAWKVSDTAYAGSLAVNSDGRHAVADLALTQPMLAQLHANIDQGNDFAWTGKLDAPAFDPKPLIGDSSLKNLGLNLQGRGDRRGSRLTGSVELNQFHLLLQPLQLRFDDDFTTLTLQTLQLTSPQIKGSVDASGTITLNAKPISGALAIGWKDLELPADLVGQPLNSRGSLTAHGSTDQYHAEGDIDIGPPGKLAKLALNLDGTPKQIVLHTLKLKQPQGDLDASGTLNLQPQIAWQLGVTAHRFDPGQLFAGWQGQLDADFSTKGTLAPSGPDATIDLRKLQGQWQQHSLNGTAQLHLAPNRVVDGTLDITSGSSNVHLKAKPGQTNDANIVLAIASLGDFLPQATGRLDGQFNIRGKLPKLNLDATLQGLALDWHEQKIGQLHLQANIPDLSSPGGKIDIEAAGVEAGGLGFKNVSVKGHGTAAQHQLSVIAQGQPLSADVVLTGSLKGSTWNGTLSTLSLDLQGLPRWQLQRATTLSWNNGAANLAELCLTAGKPVLCLSGSQDKSGNLDASYSLHSVPLALVMDAIGTSDMPVRADGALEGNGKIQRNAAGSFGGNASITSSRGSVTYVEHPDQPLLTYDNLALTAALGPTGQQLSVRAQVNGNGRLDGEVTITGAQQVLGGQINLHLGSLTFIELLTERVANVKGQLDGNFRLGGTLAQPSVIGQANMEDFTAEIPDAGLKLTQGRLAINASNTQQLRITGSVQSGKGTLAIDGTTQLGAQTQSTVTLKGQQITLVDVPAAKVVASPDLLIRHDAQGLNASGTVRLDSADVNVDKLPGGGANKASPDVVVIDRAQPAADASLPINASIKVDLGTHTHLVGMGLDGHLTGVLTVNEQPGRSTRGQGQIAVSGTYKAYGQNLTIEQGQLLFASTPIDNPGLNIRADRKLNPNATVDDGQRVGLLITGTAQRPILNVFSNPVMEQSDALSYLVTGKPLSQTKGGESSMVSTAAQALGSAAGNLLAKSVGSKIGVDDVGVSSSDALGGNSAFTVGKYLSPRLYLSYGIGLFEPGQVITLRYRLTKRWNFEAQNATDFNRASFNYRYEK